MLEFLEMYINTLEDLHHQKFTDYALLRQLIKEYFDDEVSEDDIRRYYEHDINEEDLRLQIDNLQIQY